MNSMELDIVKVHNIASNDAKTLTMQSIMKLDGDNLFLKMNNILKF